MARIFETNPQVESSSDANQSLSINLEDNSAQLPEGYSVGEASLSRDGADLIMGFEAKNDVTISNYFDNEEANIIQDDNGGMLSNGLVHSFLQSSPEYAQASSMVDESPIGAVEEVSGGATITRVDGSSEPVTLGTMVFEGDVVQTSQTGAVNIIFTDETSLAVSENAKMAIDNYEFDPATESGATDVSVLRGVFVYTSGLIGRDDPDDVSIETPVGSIGIRGTIIAGKIDTQGESEISVLEGAIVVSNAFGETTLSEQFETVKISSFEAEIQNVGVQPVESFTQTYGSVSDVLPNLFSSINDVNAALPSQEAETVESVETQAEEDNLDTQEEAVDSSETDSQDDTSMMDIMPDSMEFDEGMMELDMTEDTASDISVKEFTMNGKNSFSNSYKEFQQFTKQKFFEGEKEVIFARNFLYEGADVGDTIGILRLRNFSDIDSVSLSSADYTITQLGASDNWKIELSAAGAANADSTAGAVFKDLSAFNIDITVNGITETLATTFTPRVYDAKVNANLSGDIEDFGYGAPYSPVARGGPVSDAVNFNGDTVNLVGGSIENLSTSSTILSDNAYSSLKIVGDLNNSGHDDLIAGTTEFNANQGRIVLIDGRTGNTDYSTEASDFGTHVTGAGDRFGNDVAGIGDFDGDGLTDFIVGSFNNLHSSNIHGSGAAFVFTNGSGGEYINSLHVQGIGLSDQDYGTYVDGIGDFNGDGLSDVLVGYRDGAQIIFGNTTGINVDQSALSATQAFEITGGVIAAGSAGDFNGDGYDDVAVAFRDGGGVNTYVVYGVENGSRIGDYDLNDLENSDYALKIDHHDVTVGQAANYEISTLGDINGDGFDDIRVGGGSNQFDIGGGRGGSAHRFVTNGSTSLNEEDDGHVDGDDTITASRDDQSLVGNVSTFSDNGFADTRFSGGNNDSSFEISSTNFSKIDGGSNEDKIEFSTEGTLLINLDFTGVNFEQIEQIEEIAFGNVNQRITLTAENIFNLLKSSDDGSLKITAFDDGSQNQLYIEGQHFDQSALVDTLSEIDAFFGSVDIATDYQDIDTFDGQDYAHFEIGGNDGYDLYIDTDFTGTTV